MKKIVALLLLSFSVQAGVTLDWEIEFPETVFPLHNEELGYEQFEYGYLKTLGNGNLFFSISTHHNHPLHPQHKFYVIDKDDGSITYIMTLTSNPTHIKFFPDGCFSLQVDVAGNGDESVHYFYPDSNNSYQNIVLNTEWDNESRNDNADSATTLTSYSHTYIYNQDATGNWPYKPQIRKYTITSDNPTPTLSAQTSSGFNQDNYVINWDSSSGAQYQIQSSTDLTNWVDVGSALIGTGDMMTWANHVTNSQAFYRVVEE